MNQRPFSGFERSDISTLGSVWVTKRRVVECGRMWRYAVQLSTTNDEVCRLLRFAGVCQAARKCQMTVPNLLFDESTVGSASGPYRSFISNAANGCCEPQYRLSANRRRAALGRCKLVCCSWKHEHRAPGRAKMRPEFIGFGSDAECQSSTDLGQAAARLLRPDVEGVLRRCKIAF
jgi:hypothetical protein